MTSLPPSIPPHGPLDAPVVILGECPGTQEEAYNKVFVGSSGHLLKEMLKEAGFSFDDLLLTNVFGIKPQAEKNDISWFFRPKKDPEAVLELAPAAPGKYLGRPFLPQVEATRELLLSRPRKLIIALGNTALWFTMGRTGIGNMRGVFYDSPYGRVLPTYHPAAVARQWALRSVAVADLQKAFSSLGSNLPTEEASPLKLHLNPSVADLSRFLALARGVPALSIDVETERGQVRTFGVGVSDTEAFVIPFFCTKSGVTNYWTNPADEVLAWRTVDAICSLPCPKVLQNGLYDVQRLYDPHRIIIRNYIHDDMLLHHSLQPEMEKGLAFLASIYLNTTAWKFDYHRRGDEQEKSDE